MSKQPSRIANSIGHFDIAGPDTATLQAFYEATFGWKTNERGPGYSLIETAPGGINGALVEAADASLTIGIVVPDLSAALAAGLLQGGTIAMPAVDNGWVQKAQLRDPAGNLLTLIQG
ncbi:VOC family protein [Devosia sp.]|uniref:VOC family protein n=1 Tax=Devosia sp. TaxID=1871048 RepID=UPI0032649F67